MPTCTVQDIDKEVVANSIRNHRQIAYIHPSMDYHQKAEVIRTISDIIDNEYIIDDKKRIGVDEQSLFERTVTQIINPRGKSKPNDKNVYTKTGDLLHMMLNEFMLELHQGNIPTEVYNKYKAEGINDQVLQEAVRIVKTLLKEANDHQDLINKRLGTNDRFELLAEQRIGSAARSVAGKPDVIILFSNDTGMIYDFKTFYSKPESYQKKYYMHYAQMKQYKRILLEDYGIGNIIDMQVIPIRGEFVFNTVNGKKENSGKLKSIRLQAAEFKDAKTKFINGTYAKLGFAGVDKWLKTQYDEIKKISQQFRQEKNQEKKRQLKIRLTNLQEAVKKFVATSKFDVMSDHLNTVLFPQITNILNNRTLENLEPIEALQIINDYTDSLRAYTGITSLFKSFENFEVPEEQKESFKSTLLNIRLTSEDLLEALENIRRKIGLDQIEDGYFADPIERDELKPTKSLGFIARHFSRLSSINHPIFKVFFKKVREAREKLNIDLRVFSEDLITKENKVFNKLKSVGKTFEDVFIDPVVTDDEGRHTKGNYISKFSEEGRKKLESILANAKAKNNPALYASDNPNAPAFIRLDAFNEWFTRVSGEKEARLKAEFPEDDASVARGMEDFTKEYDIINHPDAFFKHYRKWVSVKPEFLAAHKSAKWLYIESIPEFKDWFEFVEKSNSEFREMLGITDYYSLPDNFYPNVRKEMLDRFLANPLGIGELSTSWLESMTVREEDTFLGQHDAEGNPIKTIPKMFITKLSEKERSYNYGRSLLVFAKMAYNYKHATELETWGTSLKAILSEGSQYADSQRGNKMFDYAADPVIKSNQEAVELFELFNDYYTYGIHTQEKGRNFTFLGKQLNTTKLLQKMMSWDRARNLGLKLPVAASAHVASHIALKAIKKKESYFTEKQLEQAYKDSIFDREKYNALTTILDVTNENFVDRISNQHFERGLRKILDERTLYTPYRKGDEFLFEKESYAMLFNYGLNAENQIRRLKNLPEGTKSLGEILKLEKQGEEAAKPTIEGKSTQEVYEILESFRTVLKTAFYRTTGTVNEDNIYSAQTKLIGQVFMMYKTWMPGIMGERFGKITYQEITDTLEMPRYTAVAHWLTPGGKRSLKKIVSQTTKLMVDTLTYGHAKKLLYKDGNRVTEDLAKLDFEAWRAEHPELAGETTLEDYIQAQEGQLKATMLELRTILMFAGMIMLLGSDDEDDFYSYKNNYGARQSYKILRKALSELTYFYNPTSLTDLLNKPVSLLGLSTTIISSFTNAIDETRDLIVDGGFNEDKSDNTPPAFYTTKLIKGFNGLRSVVNIFEEDTVVR